MGTEGRLHLLENALGFSTESFGGVQDHSGNRLHGIAMRERAKKEKCVFSSAGFAAALFTSLCRALLYPAFRIKPLFTGWTVFNKPFSDAGELFRKRGRRRSLCGCRIKNAPLIVFALARISVEISIAKPSHYF